MSTSSFDPDDPRLTAYALGEADEADRRAVEELLAGSAAARAELEQTEALARLLAAEYAQENERYSADRANIIPLPQPGQRLRWRRATPMLSTAAGAMLCASIIYWSVKAARHPATSTTSAPPQALTSNLSPGGSEQMQARVGGTLAMNTRKVDLAAGQAPAAPPIVAAVAAAPAVPGARCVVRVRVPDGRFAAGVILSADGLILLPASPSNQPMQGLCTITLADGRDFSAVPKETALGQGWYWLRVKADGLPAAPLAKEAPIVNDPAIPVLIDPRSGELAFSPSADARAWAGAFAFDATGSLLIANPPQAMVSTARTKAAYPRAVPTMQNLRPFTPTEREIIQRAISGL